MRIRAGAARLRRGVPLIHPRHIANCTIGYALDRVARSRYETLSGDEARGLRTSDTVFVIGAGKSLLDISEETWTHISSHDTLSFSEFFRQPWIAPRFHMIGEIANVREFATQLSASSQFLATTLVVQEGWRAEDGNKLLGRRLLRSGTRVLRYRRTSRGRYQPPSRSFEDGVVHGWNSSTSATNIAYLLGWKRIVLTGIDLYDKEYFWLPRGGRREIEKRGVVASSQFPNAPQIVEMLGHWRKVMAAEGVSLEVYNPRSLLAQQIPVFSWGD